MTPNLAFDYEIFPPNLFSVKNLSNMKKMYPKPLVPDRVCSLWSNVKPARPDSTFFSLEGMARFARFIWKNFLFYEEFLIFFSKNFNFQRILRDISELEIYFLLTPSLISRLYVHHVHWRILQKCIIENYIIFYIKMIDL